MARPTAMAPSGPRSAPGPAAYLSLLLLAIVVFGPTVSHEFVWDDLEQVRDNQIIRHWSSFFDFWRKDILELSRKGGEHHSNYYRPLFYVQYLFYYKAFGLNTAMWHAMAILHHALASAAALFFLARLRLPLGVAWPAALLFVVHPAHGESVSWVAAAFNDPPVATCLLLALAAHVSWMQEGSGRHARWAALGYAAALCLKESALSMLILAPLVEWYVGPRGGWRKGARRFIPYIVVTAVYFLVRRAALGSTFGVYPGTKSVAELLPTLPMLALFYLRLLLWPVGLAPSYPLRYLQDWTQPAAWGSVLGLAAIGAFLLVATRRRRLLQFAVLWTAGCLWPVFNIRSFLPTFLAHQRYLYLASLGVCVAVAWILAQGVRRATISRTILGLVLVLWSSSNVYYDPAWKTDTSLWTRICEVDPHNPAGFDWLGARALEEGRLDEAERLFHRSIEAAPSSPYGYRNLGILHYPKRRQPAAAMAWYDRAIQVFVRRGQWWETPDLLQCRINYAACLAELGRPTEALSVLLEVAETPPYPVDAAKSAAALLRQMNKLDRVEPVLTQAAQRHPDDVPLLIMLVQYYQLTRRPQLALPYVERLQDLAPENPDVKALLGPGA